MANPFVDPEVEPTRELIRSALGPAVTGWDTLIRDLKGAGVDTPWRWFRDGGWLVKAASRARTIAWIAIEEKVTTCSFLFAERLRDAVAGLPDITPELAQQVRDEPLQGKLFRVSFTVSTPGDVERLRPILDARIALR